MRRNPFSSLAFLALAFVALGSWVVGCSDNGVNPPIPEHGAQTAPSGEYSIAWSGADLSAAGGLVAVGTSQVPLGSEALRDLDHTFFNIQSTGLHGWEVAPFTDDQSKTWLAIEPHPHAAATIFLAYDPATGLAEGSMPVSIHVPNPAINTLMKAFITRATGIANPLDVTVTKFEIADLAYSIHWTPDAKGMAPGRSDAPAFVAKGVTVEAVFYDGETQGTLTASIDQLTANSTGTFVAECPECLQEAPGSGGGGKPIVTNP